MAESYLLNIFLTNLAVRVSVNDCTLFRAHAPSDRTEQYDLSCWVIENESNQLSVELARLPATAKPVGKGTQSFKIHLHKRDIPERDLSVHTLLTAFRWTQGESKLEAGAEPVVAFSHGWNVHDDDTHGRWSWQDAQPFDEARDRNDINALVERVHSGLVTRHMGMLNTIFDTRYKELARAEGVSFHEVKARTEAFFAPYFEADDWKVAPLDLANVRYEVEGGGRLVRAFGADNNPVLMGVGNGDTCMQDLAMANLDGAWVAVR